MIYKELSSRVPHIMKLLIEFPVFVKIITSLVAKQILVALAK